MTQSDLADKLNYSDKAVSKWERAESIPDIAVLKEIADLFDVTLDYLVNEEHNEPESEPGVLSDTLPDATASVDTYLDNTADLKTATDPKTDFMDSSGVSQTEATNNKQFTYITSKFRTHGFITGMCIILVWLIATLSFVVADIINADLVYKWLAFLYAIPISAIVWLVFNSIWFNKRRNYFIISLLMWSTLISIVVSVIHFSPRFALILILGIPGQVIIYMWSSLKKKVKLD